MKSECKSLKYPATEKILQKTLNFIAHSITRDHDVFFLQAFPTETEARV